MPIQYINWDGYVIELDNWSVKFSEIKDDSIYRNNKFKVLMSFSSKTGVEDWSIKLTEINFYGYNPLKTVTEHHLKNKALAYLKYHENKSHFIDVPIQNQKLSYDKLSLFINPGSHDFTLYIETNNQNIFDIPRYEDEYGNDEGSRLLAEIEAKDIEEAKQKARERIDEFIAHLEKCKELIK